MERDTQVRTLKLISLERALDINFTPDSPTSIGFPVERSHVGVSQLPHTSAFRNLYILTCPILHRRLETFLEAVSWAVGFGPSTSLLCLLSRCTYHTIHNSFACSSWNCLSRLFAQWHSPRVPCHLPQHARLLGTFAYVSSLQNVVARGG